MYRTHTCGELNINNLQEEVILSGWVHKIRNLGKMLFIDLRDRYGVTQISFTEETEESLFNKAKQIGREFVIAINGEVVKREKQNKKIPTGEIEIKVTDLRVLNESETPPFTIEENTDGGEELRMKYRYLDLRRDNIQHKIKLRYKVVKTIRNFLDKQNFIEVETPFLIKSTPEGAKDFLVPSSKHEGEFYALPQSPQLFKQLLMISGFDRYFQIVKCFRDEDFRADRQPEFTQLDCEMSFVEQEDILSTFEQLSKNLFKEILNIEIKDNYPRIVYKDAIEQYGNDRPDIRFEMKINELTNTLKGKSFKVFDEAEYIGGICAEKSAKYSRKQLDKLTDFVKKPQIGAKGLVYIKYNDDGSIKSSVDKFYSESDLKQVAEQMQAKKGDLILILSGEKNHTLNALSELRIEMAKQLNLIDKKEFAPLWVVDFPLLEWNEEEERFSAMHHPFTSPKIEDIELIETAPQKIRANAYDLVVNGVEVGGGSVRIHDAELQKKVFRLLGFSDEQAKKQFGFLLEAFQYGAPPHAGIAFGLDRLVALLDGENSIRDYIPFPKNNSGRDTMIDAPSTL